jgi:hypothetical protein
MSVLEQYNAIIKTFRECYNKAFSGRSLVYIKRKTGLHNAVEIRNYTTRDYAYRVRTLCFIMQRIGLIFAFINKLTEKCELLTFDADEIYCFMCEQRKKRIHRSKLQASTRMSRRNNCTILTMVKAFNELGFYVRIGTYSNG